MEDRLRILMLEDLPSDVELIKRELDKNSLQYDMISVDNKSEFQKQLLGYSPDLILSDYSLPSFTGLEALQLVIKHGDKIPFIIVTGSINEETAVECIKAGASDYITKENLLRLVPAIEGALEKFKFIKQKEQAEKALLESERNFRHSFQFSNVGMCLVDLNGKFLRVNPKLCDILGYTEAELEQLNIYDLTHKKDILKTKEFYSKSIKGKLESAELEKRFIHKDGSEIFAHNTISLAVDQQNEPLYFVLHIQDITQKHIDEDLIKKLSLSIEQSPIMLMITDTEGQIEYVNPKFLEVTGYTVEEVFYNYPRILKSGTLSREFYKVLWDTIKSGKTWKGEIQNKRKNGELYWDSSTISPVFNAKGEITHFLAIKEDITSRKKMEDELLIAKNKAEESDRLKSAFLATISHELRTPLNAIIGFSELMQAGNQDSKNVLEYSSIIYHSGKNLLAIINDIFDISLIEANEVKVYAEPFSLNGFLDELFDLFKNNRELKEKNLEFKIRKELLRGKDMIHTDKKKLKKIVSNLIFNAIKFTNTGSIQFGYYIRRDETNNSLEFYVKDTGVGIPPDKYEVIFEKFRQADETNTRQYGGSGLGLTIAKKLTELLGGKIWVESELKKGTSIFFTLPYELLVDHDEIEIKSEDTGKLNWSDKTILIVEDVDTNYLYLEEVLSETGIDCLWAKNGAQAVELYERFNTSINLILMDIMLPDMNGYEVTRKIKEKDKTIPIIAQTAYALAGDREKSIEAGCDDYIAKPISQIALFEIISKYLKKK
ncbi:MAG: PAS domain S-box protein [Bacteroidales bacterium]|nr:PAS domain S-box protein [Bacteroidales bacterium]